MDFGTGVLLFIAFIFICGAAEYLAGGVESKGLRQNETDNDRARRNMINRINQENIDRINQEDMERINQEDMERINQQNLEEAMKSVTPFEMGGYDMSNQMNDMNNSMNDFNNFNNF